MKHPTTVEQNWFRRLSDAVPAPPTGDTTGDKDVSWVLAATDTPDSLLADYDRACALSERPPPASRSTTSSPTLTCPRCPFGGSTST